MPELKDDLNLIKFRTGATETTDFENNIARFDFDNEILYYGGVAFGVSQDELSQAVAGKITVTELIERLQPYAKTADIPTDAQIEAISDNQIAKANQNTTLTNYATTGDLDTVLEEVLSKTTLEEVEQQGYLKSNALDDYATTGYVDQTYAKKSEIPTVPVNVSEFINDAGYITNADIPFIPTNVSDLNNDAGYITSSDVPTSNTAFTNDAGYITSADIPHIPTDTAELTNGAGFITSSDVPTKVSDLTNDTGFITSSDIPTSNTAFTNDAGFITTGATVAQANKTKGTLTIQQNGTTVKTFNGSSSQTANITVPTKVSDLSNDSNFITSAVSELTNFYNKTSIDSMLSEKMERTTASTLPTTGKANVIYMVPKSTAGTNDSYDEYMYIASKWELIGSTTTDLSDYYKKTETSSSTQITNALAGKSDTGHTHDNRYYTESEIDTKLAGKSDTGHTHVSADITDALTANTATNSLWSSANSGKVVTDSLLTYWNGAYNTGGSSNLAYCNKGAFGTMACQNITSYSTATQVNTALAGKANTGHTHDDRYYTESEMDTKLSGKSNTGHTHDDRYYTETEIDTKLSGKSDTGHTHAYLPLSGGTMSGGITGFVGDIQLVTNTSHSLVAYKNTSATKCADGSIFGSKDAPSYLRSSSDDLYHYNANKDANYKILDSNNSAHTHSYLPLSGGTVTGGTTFSGGSFGTELIVKRGDTSNGASIQFRGTDEVYGYLGSNNVKQPTWWDADKNAYTLLHNGNSAHTHSYLPLSGGTMSGAISFDTSTIASIKYRGTKSEYVMVRFVDNTADTYGNGICIGGGGLTVIGGGESSYNAITDLGYTGGDEKMVITNDGDIEFYSNCQTIASKKLGLFDSSGYWRGQGFKRSGSSDSYVLLGGGGHKELSGFSLTSHTHNYLPLSGGTMNTGAKVTFPYNSGSRKIEIDGCDVITYGATTGNWANAFGVKTNDGTSSKMYFGAFGNANTINYGYIGTAYNTPTVKIIDGTGIGVAGSVRVGATKSNETTMTGGCNMEYNTTTQCLEFKF